MDNQNKPHGYNDRPIYDPKPYTEYQPTFAEQPEYRTAPPERAEQPSAYFEQPEHRSAPPVHTERRPIPHRHATGSGAVDLREALRPDAGFERRSQALRRQDPDVLTERRLPGFFMFINGWLEAFTSSMVIVILLFTFLFRSVAVDGSSMLPTLLDEDRLLVTSMFYKPQREDIVVIIPTQSMPKALIKRVVALEGERVDITMLNGQVQVLINGKKHIEPYLDVPMNALAEGQTLHYEVPKGHVFVMGDNRNNSIDSRREEVGMVDVRSIMGKAIFRVLPFGRMGLLDHRGGLEE